MTAAPLATTRSASPAWTSVAAWGAGLIELALGAGALTSGDSPWGWGVILIALGVAGLVWGAATLARGHLLAPRTGVAGALASLVAVVAILVLDPARTSVVTVGAASVLLVAVALSCARQSRRRTDAAPPRLWVLFAAAVIVAGIVTPALGATEAGLLAPDHSDHGIVDPGHH
ncbi:hypothetical protein GCM10009775_08240 [Microbacterium aoyamense]|uniref:Uncharacterized protein n=1 Tax=Microbacterium aoyamense TaxID=344166 RepID=A0ABN2PCD1_9MICO|nr:hypothetical protein [Microbacterium aoyamense]